MVAVSQSANPVAYRHRASERGTAIFVVVLVITMLTGIGLFAARMTSSVDTATGFARQAAQAQGLTLYAGQLAADILVDQAAVIKDAMEVAASAGMGAVCPTNRGVTNTYCAYRSNVELIVPEKIKVDLSKVRPPPRPADDASLDAAHRKGGAQ